MLGQWSAAVTRSRHHHHRHNHHKHKYHHGRGPRQTVSEEEGHRVLRTPYANCGAGLLAFALHFAGWRMAVGQD